MAGADFTATDQVAFATVHTGEEPSVRYVSDLTIYDEGLVDGHWIGRYWSATGVIRPEKDIAPDLARLAHHQLDAFVLELDGQALGGHWNWEGADVAQTPHGPLVGVRLRHKLRPVALRICTQLDGTAVLQRWLEITNTGEQPAALGSCAPFAGLLWRVAQPAELLPTGKAIWSLGRYQSAIWAHEGTFGWQELPSGVTRIEGRRGRSGHARPSFFLRNDATGEIAVADLAWSGNWAYQLRYEQDSPDAEALLFVRSVRQRPRPNA